MTNRTCSIDGCDKPHERRGYCDSHARRLMLYGDPLGQSPMHLRGFTLSEKLLLNHAVDPDSGCWRWTGAHSDKGYGDVRAHGNVTPVHRVAYELWVGPIPEGLHIDHVLARGCVHRDCLNPAHLEAVTQQENIRRGNAGWNLRIRTHCPQGHPYDEINSVGARGCATCRRAQDAKRKRDKRRRLADLARETA